MAEEKLRNVAKAKRAAPVKVSSGQPGVGSSSGGDSMDRAIHDAMAKHGM
jgi:hypothetical protein